LLQYQPSAGATFVSQLWAPAAMMALTAFSKKQGFTEMMRANRKQI